MKQKIEITIPDGYEVAGKPFVTIKDGVIAGIGITLKKKEDYNFLKKIFKHK
jgi:hypothetical protein